MPQYTQLLIVTLLSPFAIITLPGDYDFCEAHLVVALSGMFPHGGITFFLSFFFHLFFVLSGLFPHGGISRVRDMENYTLL